MTAPNFNTLRQKLKQLLAPDFIGKYDHIELVEIIAYRPGKTVPINILSIAVLSEGCPNVGPSENTEFLIARQKIDGFPGWKFGLARTLRPVSALETALSHYELTSKWTLSGQHLMTGVLQVEPDMFVPPDGTAVVPINTVLRNNFWAGSHLFRLMDHDKKEFAPFFVDRRRLQSLSDAVGKALPIAFSGLCDLLGDVLIQLPVTLLSPEIRTAPTTGGSQVQAHWRPDATPHQLVLSAASRWDEVLTGASIAGPFSQSAQIGIPANRDRVVTHILDSQTSIIMGATASTSSLKTMKVKIIEPLPEPRTFAIPKIDGSADAQRISLTMLHQDVFGDQGSDANFWLIRRQDLEEKRKLAESRDFVQYRRVSNSDSERRRALADIRLLIERHGAGGVNLWDPFLSATDVLQTLFWCRHSGVPLRALTDGKDPPRKRCGTAGEADPQVDLSFADGERAVLEAYAGNKEGLCLEYRTRRGPKGWEFHDRFLIFPNNGDGPLAWSLGTSINSLGGSHHILQRVSNPAMILGAFEDLWAELDEAQHLIWKSR